MGRTAGQGRTWRERKPGEGRGLRRHEAKGGETETEFEAGHRKKRGSTEGGSTWERSRKAGSETR